ncbi:MAG: hypothetical protein QM770_03500 [Tepidisphaeraceae bacterium]
MSHGLVARRVAVCVVSLVVAWISMNPLARADTPTTVAFAQRPRSEVLVNGEQYLRPDLTRGVVNDYRDVVAWALNIKLDDAQCEQFEALMIARWPTALGFRVDPILQTAHLRSRIPTLPAAQLKATHAQMQDQILKNLHQIVGGADSIGLTPIDDHDRKEAQFFLGAYETQHPEAVAPMPTIPDVVPAPAVPDKPEPAPAALPEVPGPTTGPTSDATLVPGPIPLKRSTADAMSQVVCFLSAQAQASAYAPPTPAFSEMFARRLAAEYPALTPGQQSSLATLPAYWTQLRRNWDRMSQADRATTLARWKPMLDGLASPNASVPAGKEDQDALALASQQAAQTQARLAQLQVRQALDGQQQQQLQVLQMQYQQQQQQLAMMSNIARSAHDTNMVIIRNMGPTRQPWEP